MYNTIKDGYFYPTPEEVRYGSIVQMVVGDKKWSEGIKVLGHNIKSLQLAAGYNAVRMPLIIQKEVEEQGWTMLIITPISMTFEKDSYVTEIFSKGYYLRLTKRTKGRGKPPDTYNGVSCSTIYHFIDLMRMANIPER